MKSAKVGKRTTCTHSAGCGLCRGIGYSGPAWKLVDQYHAGRTPDQQDVEVLQACGRLPSFDYANVSIAQLWEILNKATAKPASNRYLSDTLIHIVVKERLASKQVDYRCHVCLGHGQVKAVAKV